MAMNGDEPFKVNKKSKFERLNTHENKHAGASEVIPLTYAESDDVNHVKNTNGDIQVYKQDMGIGLVEENSEPVPSKYEEFTKQVRVIGRPLFLTVLLLGVWTYIGFSLYLNPEKSVFVCLIAPFVTFYLVNLQTRGKLVKTVKRQRKFLTKTLTPKPRIASWIRRISTVVAILGLSVFLIIDIWDDWKKWVPLGGLSALICLSVLMSKNPRKINWMTVTWGVLVQFTMGLLILRWPTGYIAWCLINWMTVTWGILVQFAMGLLILRWPTGYIACRWVGEQVSNLLAYTDAGSEFVFGPSYTDHAVAFKILPTVVFFSAFISILYYLGAMQAIIKCIATVLQFFLNVTPIESFSTAAHIFIGQVESSVALRPFWNKLTESELNAIVTSGFATVAGTMIAAYVEFGIPAEHVISASFMSAPAALAIAKIAIPETEESQIKTQKAIKLPAGEESNLLEALSAGATVAIKLVAYVVVNLIAFIAVFGLLDSILSYLGERVNCPELSFQLICSYVFMPLAAAFGIPWSETGVVGTFIGTKIFLNEFIAYAELGPMIKAGEISEKSGILTTYILCGFGSVAALGINLGSLTSAAPDMRSTFSRLLVRAMINGNIACYMTACVAGMLYQETMSTLVSTTDFNSTSATFNTTSLPINVTST